MAIKGKGPSVPDDPLYALRRIGNHLHVADNCADIGCSECLYLYHSVIVEILSDFKSDPARVKSQ